MRDAFFGGALAVDGHIRLRQQSGVVLQEAEVPQHLVRFLSGLTGPTNGHGQGNIGDGHKPFSSGVSVITF